MKDRIKKLVEEIKQGVVSEDTAIQILENEVNEEVARKVSPSVLLHIHKKIKELDSQSGLVSVLQFCPHPIGMAIILRCYNVNMNKEYPISDYCGLFEIESNEDAIKRIDVIFDLLNQELKKIHIIKPENVAKMTTH